MDGLIQKQLLATGAEAQIWFGEWNDRQLVIKRRVVKGYRHPKLDDSLRQSRTKKESRLIREARKAGVPTPIIYDVIPEKQTIVIQWFEGKRVMDSIEEGIDVNLKKIGMYLGYLHRADISHGDLTTSNILYSEEKQQHCFIDFSLGDFDASLEEKGVDLHLLKEALVSVHEEPLKRYRRVLEGYLQTYPEGTKVIQRTKDIEARGRYL